ncbi:hypothetical protein ACWHLZ_45565 [Streptomyces chartreusis]
MTTEEQPPDGEDPRPWITELDRRARIRQDAYEERVLTPGRQVIAAVVITGIGIGILLSKGYRLAMTNDYAAVISAAILAVLVIGFVELHAFKKQVTELVANTFEEIDSNLEEITEGMRSGRFSLDDYGKGIAIAALEPAMVAMLKGKAREKLAKWWTRLCVLLVVALMLIFVWAGIDGHGPARWLAWYSCCITCIGVAAVLAGAIAKGQAEQREWDRILLRQMGKIRAAKDPGTTPDGNVVPPARAGQDPIPGL